MRKGHIFLCFRNNTVFGANIPFIPSDLSFINSGRFPGNSFQPLTELNESQYNIHSGTHFTKPTLRQSFIWCGSKTRNKGH